MRKWKPNELPAPLSEKLTKIYGKFALSEKSTGANKILYARELSDHEKALVYSNQMMQALYKFDGTINFLRFNRAVSQMISLNEALRSNFVGGGDINLAITFNGRDNLPEIVRQNAQKLSSGELESYIRRLMDADRRRAFDPQKDTLIRMTILHTAPNEYMMLVTMSQLLNENFSVEDFLNGALELGLPPAEKNNSSSDSARLLAKPQIESSIRDYWSKILTDLPIEQQLPFYKPSKEIEQQYVYRAVVPYDIASEIRRRAQSNRLMLMAILQTAWGLMLQDFNRSDDAAYCSLMPSRDRSMAFSTIPIRLKTGSDMSIAQLIAAQFQQLLVSQPYSRFDMTALEELPGASDVFNHFLSFIDFDGDDKFLAQADSKNALRLLARKYWNATDDRLGLHFYFKDDEMSAVLKYDASWLTFDEAMQLMRRYLATLQNVIVDWTLSLSAFKERLAMRFALAADDISVVDSRAKTQDIISKVKLLQGINEGTLQYFFKVSRLDTRFEGDRISEDELSKNFILVTDGMLNRNIDVGDGWFNTLDMVPEGLPLNEAVLLENRRCKLAAEVVSETATLLIVPLDEMNKILKQSPQLWQNLARHALSEMENYQSIWVQA